MIAHEGEKMAAPVAPTEISRRDLLKLGGAAVAAGTVLPLLGREAAEAQTPKRGGVFRIRGEDATTGFDPHLFSNHHRISTNLSFTHSRLVKVKAGPSIVPGTLPVEPTWRSRGRSPTTGPTSSSSEKACAGTTSRR
jgi:hypothetical protein